MIPVKLLKPRRDWVLVLDDQRRGQTSGGIFLPGHETGIEKVTEGTGELIGVGPGLRNAKLELVPGQRIIYRAFLKHAQRVWADEVWPDKSEKIYFLIDTNDVFGIVAPGVDVGVFSGRPQVPGAK